MCPGTTRGLLRCVLGQAPGNDLMNTARAWVLLSWYRWPGYNSKTVVVGGKQGKVSGKSSDRQAILT